MDRLDRLFGLLLELQDGRVHTAADLASQFGVSVRTLYRDASTLVREGIPLRAEAGVGYQLKPGFFLSPLDFTPDEAVVLRLGLAWMQSHTSGRWARQTQTSLSKVSAALGPKARAQADRLAAMVQLFSEKRTLDLDDSRVRLCMKAIEERRTLQLEYTARDHATSTTRVVEPAELHYSEGTWYLEGWCRLRQSVRAFRFDRIDGLTWHGQPFLPVARADSARQRRWKVVVAVPLGEWRWVAERQHWGWEGEERDETTVRATYAIDELEEFLPWLLSWGPRVRVLSPAELVALVRSRASALVRLLT